MNLDNIKAWIDDKEMNVSYGETLENKPCFIANWNNYDRLEHMFNVMERHGYDIELLWDDTYKQCSNCYRYMDGTPSYYGHQPKILQISGYEEICGDCAPDFIEDIIDFYKNDNQRAIPTWLIEDVKSHGFACLDDGKFCKKFEIGFHEGQNDDPVSVEKDIRETGILNEHDFIFAITNIGQFDVQYTILLREVD